MTLTDAQILIRRCDRSKVNELPCPAHHQTGDITEVTRVTRTRLKTGPHAGNPAPAAAQLPPVPAAVGAFIVPSFAHAADVTSQEQQKS